MRTNPLPTHGLLAVVGLLLVASGAGADRAERAERVRAADSLHARAIENMAVATLDARRLALSQLERASLLDPGQHRIWLDLGRLCLERGERKRGRECYERARRAAPDDAEAHQALGSAWTWEWLSSFDPPALAQAVRNLVRAAELAPHRAANWSALSAMAIARGQLVLAERAALRGREVDPAAWDPMIARACAAYRRGELALADRAFREARAHVPEALRRRFDAAVWVHDEELVAGKAKWIGDPDATTPENEAELDYLTRLGLALLIFRDVHGVRWDMRAELFVRYGPPASVEVDPLSSWPFAYAADRHQWEMPPNYFKYAPEPLHYPFNVQAWNYPDLGIRAELWDRSLNQDFDLPAGLYEDRDARADPALVAMHPDLVSLDGGRGVFRSMPPGAKPVPARGHIAAFPSDRGTVLLAHLVTDGSHSDSLMGAWAVVAPDGTVLTRGARLLSPSACDPVAERIAEFSAIVPPGDYRVDLSVSGSGGRRGLLWLGASVPAPVAGLELSDLVMLCGATGLSAGSSAVRLEPNLERRVSGKRPLAVYLEIGHLTPGSDGLSRFAYTYSLRRVNPDGEPKRGAPAAYEASREESHEGTLRRQFIAVATGSLKPGTYDLRVEVRDLVAGSTATTGLRFERE